MVNLSMAEEDLSLSADGGAGFYPAQIGERLEDRYRVLNKLGHNPKCTVWLVLDER